MNSIGDGFTTTLIRVFAAMGIATDLKTMTSESVKIGLTRAVDTGRPVVECLTEVGFEQMEALPADHYLHNKKFN